MEVHHHPDLHHKSKKRHEYLLDSIFKYRSQNVLLKKQQELVNQYFTSVLDNLIQVTDLRKSPLSLNANDLQIHDYLNYKFAEGLSSEYYMDDLNATSYREKSDTLLKKPIPNPLNRNNE